MIDLLRNCAYSVLFLEGDSWVANGAFNLPFYRKLDAEWEKL